MERADELSIDSATNKKVTTATKSSKSKRDSANKKATKTDQRAQHFAIDWRQLTYYEKDNRPYLSKLLCRDKREEDGDQLGAHHGSQFGAHQQQQQQQHRKRILNSLDGCFKSGQLSAILGPSGAGKTTFLSCLFGSKQEQAYGSTRVTWFRDAQHRRPYGSAERPKRPIRIAFLPQHDHLLHHLSVYETLMFASKIKNVHQSSRSGHEEDDHHHHNKIKRNFHAQNVRRVAKMLKLTECLETRCGKLSGGQYKRVSIGQELLSQPDVIILDEPTSGLDAMTCLTTIRTLKSIVGRHPMSIVLTIHQPDVDVFNLFDQVYVIAQGGRAIYEGSPAGIVGHLAQSVGLQMPSDTYNPARFIVENAFLFEPEEGVATGDQHDQQESSSSSEDEHDDDDDLEFTDCKANSDKQLERNSLGGGGGQGLIRRSLASITEALTGRESPAGCRLRDSGRRPLLNIGIQTADGQLITSKQLQANHNSRLLELEDSKRLERYNLLRRLNDIQRLKYHPAMEATSEADEQEEEEEEEEAEEEHMKTSNGSEPESDYSSAGSYLSSTGGASCAMAAKPNRTRRVDFEGPTVELSSSQAATKDDSKQDRDSLSSSSSSTSNTTRGHHQQHQQQQTGDKVAPSDCSYSIMTTTSASLSGPTSPVGGGQPGQQRQRHKLKRQFDKQLSAKHNNSRQKHPPIWYHTYLLTHRTWLSIRRDPVFFGIQLAMHTTIPILLALIFGSTQEEGCPRVGNFDLVEFAYSDTSDFIHSTVHSIRKSIGNIGVVFFEMFVLCFAINCITALVFPSDMFVLLKEYRNGWYSLRSYFFGRTLADLPVPVVLHSLAMTILYYMTGQPLAAWRFLTIIGLVIMASLTAQSVGLTVGALLMRSSQSAVLAAAGIVAPFFALSGFIVRIHTLTFVAKLAAHGSYLYHLLNGFIIMRYGFNRCPCRPEDFDTNSAHEIPANLHTMASIWIGTFSDEYSNSSASSSASSAVMQRAQLATNRTQNIDPNIDVVEKMTNAFKMANSYGHDVSTCADVLPYAMLDFNLRDHDLGWTVAALAVMLLVSRLITFTAIYYKVRSVS